MRLFIDFPMLGHTSLIALWIPKIMAQISHSVTTEFSIFVTGLCHSMQSSVVTCSLSSFLDYVVTDFDNVVTKFWCSSLVLVATGMYCVTTPNMFPANFSCPSTSRVCRNIIFLVATNIYLFSLSTLSR